MSIDCKATVKLGEFSRGGKTRGDYKALDHDFCEGEKYIPLGILDEDTGQLFLNFGNSAKTSDFIVDGLENWWNQLSPTERNDIGTLQIKADNGPESSGRRTQFLNRMVAFANRIRKPIHLLYYPPYHSKYNPIERCWGILEQHWNGAKLTDLQTLVQWAQSMTWKGIHPVVHTMKKVYEKGITLSKRAMKSVEQSLQRNPQLPQWDIVIRPRPT